MFTIDAPLSYYLLNHTPPGVLRELFRVVEGFGNGLGVLLLAVAMFQLDPLRRACIPWLLLVSLGAGGVANLIKSLVTRHRPSVCRFEAVDSFVGFGDNTRLLHEGAANAFPSGHTATAVALAFALTAIYPSARNLFWFAAISVACQRVAHGAHFASDVFTGALVGWTCAYLISCWRPVNPDIGQLARR